VVDQARIAHDVDPAHGSDDEADPERKHNEQKKRLFVPALAAVEKIGGDIAHDHAENDRLERDPNRPDENFGIKEIFEEFGVISELEGRNVRAAGGAQPETVHNHEAHRYDEQ